MAISKVECWDGTWRFYGGRWNERDVAAAERAFPDAVVELLNDGHVLALRPPTDAA
jgi:hypothetical protein